MEYKHFSHEHTLTLYRVQPGQQFQCHGCHQPCRHEHSIYACWKCSFFLHEHCGNANRYVKHPSHAPHPLVLVPSPTYCSGSYLCNGCGGPGTTFSYCCPLCEVDLHVHCAYLPLKVKHNNHQHEISINFKGLEEKGNSSAHYCKICSKELSSKNWFYSCDENGCDFRVHTFCATSEVKPVFYQDDGPDQERIQIFLVPANQVPEPKEEAPVPEDVLSAMMRLQMQQQINSIINGARF